MQRLEAALDRAWPQCRTGSHRFGDALDFAGAEVLKIKEATKQFPSALGDYDRVRVGKCLQARREVGCLADDATLLRLSRSDQVADHDEPSRDADTALERTGCLQCANRCDQLQSGPHRPFGVVLVGLRIAEVHQHAVAHVLRDEPAEAPHSLGDALLIGGNDLA